MTEDKEKAGLDVQDQGQPGMNKVRESSVNSEFVQKMIIFFSRAFVGVEWNKKARIVVEYDPGKTYTRIEVFKEDK